MRRTSLKMLVVLAAIIGVTATALAADGTLLRPKADADGQMGLQRLKQGGAGRGLGLGLARRLALRRFILGTAEGKAEQERFRTELKGFGDERKTLREAVKADIQAGKTPKEALEAHATDVKALLKKVVGAVIGHRQKMLEAANAHIDDMVNKIFERRLERAGEMKGRLEELRQRRLERQDAK